MFYLVCRKSFLTYFGKTFICYWANLNLFYTLWKFGCKITIVCWQDFSCPFYLHHRTDPVDSSPFILQLLTHTCNCFGHTQSHANTYLCLSLSLSLSLLSLSFNITSLALNLSLSLFLSLSLSIYFVKFFHFSPYLSVSSFSLCIIFLSLSHSLSLSLSPSLSIYLSIYHTLSLSLSLSCFFLFLYLSLWHSRSLLICCFPKMFQLTRALNEWTSGWLRYFVQILLRW